MSRLFLYLVQTLLVCLMNKDLPPFLSSVMLPLHGVLILDDLYGDLQDVEDVCGVLDHFIYRESNTAVFCLSLLITVN